MYLNTVLTKVFAIVFVFGKVIVFVFVFKYYAMYLDPSLVVTAFTYGKHVGWWCAPHIILLYVQYFNTVVASLNIAIITLYQFNIVQA